MNASINILSPEELAKLFEANDDFYKQEEAFKLLYEKLLHFETDRRQRSTTEGFLMHPINCHRLDVIQDKYGRLGVAGKKSGKHGQRLWLRAGAQFAEVINEMVILVSRRNKPPVIVKVPVGLQDFLRKQAGEPFAYHEMAL